MRITYSRVIGNSANHANHMIRKIRVFTNHANHMIRMIRVFANHANHMIRMIRVFANHCESYDSNHANHMIRVYLRIFLFAANLDSLRII